MAGVIPFIMDEKYFCEVAGDILGGLNGLIHTKMVEALSQQTRSYIARDAERVVAAQVISAPETVAVLLSE